MKPDGKEFKNSEFELRAIVDALTDHAWYAREDGYCIYCNQRWLDYTGFSREEALGWSYRDKIHPDDAAAFSKKWMEVSADGEPFEAKARLRRRDGEYRWFLIVSVPVKDETGRVAQRFWTNTDIDDRKRAEALLEGEKKVLEMVATGKPLREVLEELCHLVDRLCPESMASVLLVDSSDRLRMGAGPRFPKDFLELVDGIKIGPKVGSCGTAAFRKEQVIVTNIQEDALWSDYCGLANQFDLRAGWSTPILSSNGSVSGVFGIYWDKPRNPSPLHLHIIAQMTHLASVAIERQRGAEAVAASERLARGQAEALGLTLDALSRETEPERIVRHVLGTVTTLLDGDSSSVWLRDEDSGLMLLEYELEEGKFRNKVEAMITKASPSLPLRAIHVCPEVLRSGKPSVLEDIREGPEFPSRAHMLARGVITIVVVPMVVAGEVEGAISVRFTQKRKFRAEELELAQSLASQAILVVQLARLSAHSRETAVIGERNRLARDIHDTLAQGFTGVIMHVEAAEEALSRKRMDVVPGHVRRAGEIARDGLREARRSVRALRPLALEDKKLSEALEEMVKKFTAGTTVEGEFTSHGSERRLPAEWESNILRVAQEALTNVLRHAKASIVSMSLVCHNDEVLLNIRDDGRGFDSAAQQAQGECWRNLYSTSARPKAGGGHQWQKLDRQGIGGIEFARPR